MFETSVTLIPRLFLCRCWLGLRKVRRLSQHLLSHLSFCLSSLPMLSSVYGRSEHSVQSSRSYITAFKLSTGFNLPYMPCIIVSLGLKWSVECDRSVTLRAPSRLWRSTSLRWAKSTDLTERVCRGSRPERLSLVTSWRFLVRHLRLSLLYPSLTGKQAEVFNCSIRS